MIARRNYDSFFVDFFFRYGVSEDFYFFVDDWEFQSLRWGIVLKYFYRMYRFMIGKFKIFIDEEYKIVDIFEGGIYLGFYEE